MTMPSRKAMPSWRPVALGLLFVAALFLSLATSPLGIAGPQLGQDEQALLDLINGHRAENGLSPLSVSPTLTDAAAWMSRDMGEKDYFNHTDSLGRDPFQRMADFGYNYNAWKGENLAAGSDTPQMTFQLWRDSPGHNANMLNPNFVVVGLAKAYVSDSSYYWYWAADFGGYDEGGSPPPTSTPVPTLTPEPSPPSPPEPTLTPEPSPTRPPEPTLTPTPSPTRPPEPTPTPEPSPTSPPIPTLTPTLEASPPPIDEPPSPEAEPSPEVEFPSPPGADLGLAPPTRDSEPAPDGDGTAPTVRELVAGWNQFQCPPGAMRLADVLTVDKGKVRAIYAWDANRGTWRRYLPGIDIPGLNTLTELTDQQTIWILASESFLLTLPA
jgi:uncharacterized protein YkwD